ncbi:MAG: MotA/TolQ/ExbB proton channel family protein [Spirochaetia bacterium]|jgi:biopolymer transport protein ExbB|nr:MotA/TolQ/ExbB proton channel family protein [Spirochaetia bacterium]
MSGKIIISIFDSIPLWVMLFPIFICSITVLAVFIERVIFYKNIRMDYRLLVSGISAKLRESSPESAMALCAPYRGPLIEMIKKMLLSWNDTGDAELRIRDIAETTIRSIERFANLIATIGTVSPMLGLLGTVTGMMKSFSGLANMAPSSHDLLAQGITEALITTAFGLVVAIPSIIFYNYLVSKAETYTREIEYIANIFFESKGK